MYWRCVLICVPGVLNFTVTKLAHFRRKPEKFVLITSVQLQYIMNLPCTKYHYSFFLQRVDIKPQMPTVPGSVQLV